MQHSNLLKYFITLSRPRFWIYIFGPYILGLVASWELIQQSEIYLYIGWYALFFLFPANYLIYSINDWSDQDTDQWNVKKDGYEQRFQNKFYQQIRWGWVLSILMGIVPLLFLLNKNNLACIFLLLFFITSLGYSVPPIRAKARPIWDGICNILYALPGFFSYALCTGALPSWGIMSAALAWCMAMHAFSAIPDIEADKKAHIATSATLLGVKGTLWYCTLLWSSASVVMMYIHTGSALALLLYSFLMISLLYKENHHSYDVEWWYRKFPYINAFVGMILFFQIVLTSFV